jgi:diguanylate cyclase (GGDEF)-like protein
MSIHGPQVVATFALENSAELPVAEHGRVAEGIRCEQARLDALERYDIIDTAREEAFDRITRVASKALGVPICTISLIDGHRAWVKSGEGVPDRTEVPREHTFCYHTIQQNEPLVVSDATEDPRFKSNPFVLGEPRVRFYAGVPLHTREGVNVGTFCVVDLVPRHFSSEELAMLTDFARMVMDQLDLRLLVATDSLTQTLSRRAFKDELRRATALALRHDQPLSCLVFDIDHFKRINDSYGHAAGDTVLMRVSAVCRELLRDSDRMGRIGGEEFAILLPNTPRRGARDVAEKLRLAVEKLRFRFGNDMTGVTASLGVASCDKETRDAEALLLHADRALYDAKQQGRNRSVVWLSAEDRLAVQRRRVLKAGQILFNGRSSTVDCTVRSLSAEGAGLDVYSSGAIPRRFELAIRGDGLCKPCRVVSQTEKHIEVAFC